MPSGPFLRCNVEYGFKPEKRDKYCLMYDWMDYLAYSKGVKIERKFNMVKKKRLGRRLIKRNNSIMQLHGCFWHSREYLLTKSVKERKWHKNRQQKYEKPSRQPHIYKVSDPKPHKDCGFQRKIKGVLLKMKCKLISLIKYKSLYIL